MPRTRFDKYKYRQRDELLELIQGRITCGAVPIQDVAGCLGISKRQTYNRLKTPSEEWKLGDLCKVCRLVGISREEFRGKVVF